MIRVQIGEVIRSLFFLFNFTFLPGFIIIRLISGFNDFLENVGSIVGWSIVMNALFAYGVQFFGGTLVNYAVLTLGFNVVGVIFIVIRNRFYLTNLKIPFLNLKVHWYLVILIMVVVLWFFVIFASGPRVDYVWDQWFHISHIEEAASTNKILPPNPVWPDVTLSEIYGLWHTLMAAVSRSASVSTLTLWYVGNAYMASLSVLIIYSVSSAFYSKPILCLLSAVVFVGSGVGALEIVRTFLYPWGIATLLLWVGFSLFFRYLKSGRLFELISSVVIGLMPIFIHPQEYIFLCFGVFALGVSGILLHALGSQAIPDYKRIVLFFLLIILIGGPILFIKYPSRIPLRRGHQVDGVSDQDRLALYPSIFAKALVFLFPYYWKIGLLWYSLVPFNVFSLLLLPLLPRSLDGRVRWLLQTLTVAPMVAALVPGFSWVTHYVLGETYAWRLLNLIPTSFVWSPIIVGGLSIVLGRAPKHEMKYAEVAFFRWAYFALVGFLLVGVGMSILVTIKGNDLAPAEIGITPLRSMAMFNTIDTQTPEPVVVLSDPTTSYIIPALTKHHVVLHEPSHGTREDINTRLIETRALLSSPQQSAEAAISILRNYDVRYVVINKLALDDIYFLHLPFYSDYTLPFLRQNELCFAPIYQDNAFEVFEYMDCAADDLAGKDQAPRQDLSPDDIEHKVQKHFTSDLLLEGVSFPNQATITTDQSLDVDLYWRITGDFEEPYAIWVNWLCDYPGRAFPYGKILREARERFTGKTYGTWVFGWLPIPPSGISSGDLLRQSFTLLKPSELVEDTCDISVFVLDPYQATRKQEALPYLLMEREHTLSGIKVTKRDY